MNNLLRRREHSGTASSAMKGLTSLYNVHGMDSILYLEYYNNKWLYAFSICPTLNFVPFLASDIPFYPTV